MDADTFAAEAAALEAARPTLDVATWHARRQALHLARAEPLEAAGDPRAEEHLREAEACQWVLGSFSTGAGEGLASMAALYGIMARRARLHERLAASDPRHAALAVEAWRAIVEDPNGLGRRHAADLARARALAGR